MTPEPSPAAKRVGGKRGPYRPRTKPNWNKEILQQERAEKKAEEKKQKQKESRERRIKPPKPKPLPPLATLPVEILDVIVAYILPTAHPLGDYLPHPKETPYPPTSINITASAQSQTERWGSIPQRVLDIINFGKCCRQTMRAVERVVGGLGGNTSNMSSPRVSSTLDELRSDEKRQLFLRLSHGRTSGDDIFAFAMRSRTTLEHIVLHHCGGDHGKASDMRQLEAADASPINRTKPLQFNHPAGFVALPHLRSLQIGPDVCVQCAQACLHLFTSRAFFSKPAEQEPRSPEFVLTRTHGSYGGWTSQAFEQVAAPQLEAIQIHVASSATRSRQYGASYAEVFNHTIDKDLCQRVKTFSLILPAAERKWGGFGVSGHSSSVRQKLKEEVEKDLAERARAEIVAPGLSNQKGKQIDDKVKEKWAAQAKAALVKPAPRQSRTAAEAQAVAAALVSSIKPVKPKGTPPAPPPVTLDALSRQDAPTPPPADSPTPPSADDSPTPPPGQLPAAAEGPEKKTVTGYDGQAIANRNKRHQQFKQLLNDIAEAFPNLVSLQVLRRGNARVDIVEDLLPIEDYAEVYVTPLRRLHKLEHVDLGLAIVGRREVRDFPLALALPAAPESNLPAAVEVGIRKRILDRDIILATRAGDDWRQRVLKRFVLGKEEEVEEESSDDFSFANPPATLAAASEEATPAKLPTGWPRGVRSGFVYSADLEHRAMFNGVLTTWEQGVEAWRGAKGKEGLILRKTLISL